MPQHRGPLARRHSSRSIPALALTCWCVGSLVGGPARAQEQIEIRSGLVVPRMGQAGRAPFFTDPVALAYARGERVRPAEGDTLAFGDGGEEWKAATAEDDGWFRGRAMAGGHLFATVESDRARVMILDARGDSLVYVNDEPRTGDPYGNGLIRVPVLLHEGTNTLLFRGARGQLRASLVEPDAPIAFDTVDFTLPDQIEGEEGDLWAGVPLLNATEEDAPRLIVRASAGGTVVETAGISVPRLSVYKAPARLPRGAEDADGKIAVALEIVRDGAIVHRKELSLRSRKPDDKHVRTFVSGIDGSVQYYAVTPMHAPEGALPEHPALFLTLHGASVEGSGQAAAYGFKDWGNIVAPTNRRPFGFDWEDWGRLDAIEVLDAASALFHADPDRTYLTGHSMGGHGTWQVGAQFPDRFAAIGPSAGWISFWSYGGLIDYGTGTPEREAFTRAASPSDTLALSDNYAGLGVYILHGDADDNVPVEQARQMRTRLAEFHPNFAYYERPGAGHWWGNACVDWAPMFEFFAANRRPAPLDHLRFTTASPGVSADFRWASVLEQVEPMKLSRIDLTLDAPGGKIEGTTENVARLALRLGETRRSITRKNEAGEEIETVVPSVPGEGEALTIVLDGETLSLTPGSFDEPLYLTRVGGSWRPDSGPHPERKGPGHAGPFKNAFANRALLVYATGGSAEENAWAFQKARFDAETFKYRGNGAFEVVSDAEFLAPGRGGARADASRNVILYGNSDTNRAWGAVLDGRGLTLTRESVAVGSARHAGGDFGVLAVRPRAGSERSLVGVVGGTTLAGCMATDRLPYFVSGVAYPDYTVVTPEVYLTGIDGVVEAGFFAGDWAAPGSAGADAGAGNDR